MAAAERARLLLHWVNSLPLTACLLVDDLADLRFGDVLIDIARWVQRRRLDVWGEPQGCGLEELPAVGQQEAVRVVVGLAASECRSADGDAVFVLNSADCVARIMEGDGVAIGAVLGVLRRLCQQLPPRPRRRLSPTASDKHRMLQTALIEEQASKTATSRRRQIQETLQAPNRTSPALRTCPPQNSRANSDLRSLGSATGEVKAGQPKAKVSSIPIKNSDKRQRKAPNKRRSTSAMSSKSDPSTSTNVLADHNKSLMDVNRGFRDHEGLHVFGMLDPTAKSRATKCPTQCNDVQVVRRVWQWLTETLGLKLAFEKYISERKHSSMQKESAQKQRPRRRVQAEDCSALKLFQDGVLLCQIAAAARQLARGAALPQHRQTSMTGGANNLAPLILHGCERQPQTRADSIRNIALARTAFRRLGVSKQSLSALDGLGEASMEQDASPVWRVLDELRGIHVSRGFSLRGTEPLSATESSPGVRLISGTSNPSEQRSPRRERHEQDGDSDDCIGHVKTRAYISAEQCAVVDEWLESLGFLLEKNPRGVLQDAIRNGVLLCALRAHVLPEGTPPSAYYKAPRSLVEARENVARALNEVSSLLPDLEREGYTGAQAIENVLLGNRQVVYGILWHMWQLSCVRLRCSSHEREKGEEPSKGGEECAGKTGVIHPTPVVLDVPAATLAHEDAAPPGAMTHSRVQERHEIAWEPETDQGGDIFPSKSGSLTPDPFNSEEIRADKSDETVTPDVEVTEELVRVSEKRLVDAKEVARATDDGLPHRPVALCALKRKLSSQRRPSPAQVDLQPLIPSHKQVDAILLWLKGLSIHLKHPDALQDPSAVLVEFQSGVLLCRIVEKLEYLRGIPGVVKPKPCGITRASALHNITKALAILQHKKTMPLHLLRRASSVYEGDRAFILCLLSEMRKAYGHHLAGIRSLTDL